MQNRILDLRDTMYIRIVGIKQPMHNNCLQSTEHPLSRS